MATLITALPGALPGTPIDQLVTPEDRSALRQTVAQQHHSPAIAYKLMQRLMRQTKMDTLRSPDNILI